MGLFERLKLGLRPPRLEDADFGPLLFMYVSNAPERSYWEAEWNFPPVGYAVSIGIPGDRNGPTAEGRAFFLSRVREFDRIVSLARPRLDEVFKEWLDRPVSSDLWADVKLAGFGVEDPAADPVSWDVSFEATGEKWLGITVPFVGDDSQEAVVDT